MRIESALFASREGLQTQGRALTVIGDNIANANTTGFKGSRVEFSDILGGSISEDTTFQTGGGSQVSAVRSLFNGGEAEFTGRQLDVAITGNGFFMTGDAADPSFTRNGTFDINKEGILVDRSGDPVLGFQGDGTTLGPINMRNLNTNGTPTSAIKIVGNLNSASEIKTPVTNPTTFTELRQGSSYIQTVDAYDSLGNRRVVTLSLTKTATNTWSAQAFMDGSDVGQTAGVPVSLGQTTINFTDRGVVDPANQATTQITATAAYNNGAAPGNFTINFGGFTQFGFTDQFKSVTNDGSGAGNITGYEFDRDGTIFATLDSGSTTKIGTLRLGDVPNRDGLFRTGDVSFKAGENAGVAINGNGGTGGFGVIQGGALERSNVDIAGQFVDLVVYQRAYQASSQTLNATAQIIRDTISLIR